MSPTIGARVMLASKMIAARCSACMCGNINIWYSKPFACITDDNDDDTLCRCRWDAQLEAGEFYELLIVIISPARSACSLSLLILVAG